MWDLIKNDPILKSITILIVGIFAFSFAFSIMFGTGQSGMEHGTSTVGYSAATGLGQIIVLLSKLLIITLLVAILIATVKFVKKHVIGNEPIKGMDYLKNKPVLSILVGIGGILLLVLAMNLLAPPTSGNEMAHATATTGVASNSIGFGLTGILTLLLKLVSVVSLIGLITGLVMYFKGRYFDRLNTAMILSKENCSTCGVELKHHWKCCPGCGTEKNNKNEVNEKLALENGQN
ncbi:hypothetical protein [Bacillus sp. T3]|uniref:hypothetical protein n=1 Tax=Bacillus sp. T3 TaxID=467262 RepID=UPI0029821C49|nr:hypothetical protein [Bacillus sp. T3]